eukprot:GHVU01004966.1.p1 GENE.GHVU01004966.1~~GHVU01004966.1.p1  ORF type:complete len:145 (+),score=4.18 GHVU01004966.1:304-738(+)
MYLLGGSSEQATPRRRSVMLTCRLPGEEGRAQLSGAPVVARRCAVLTGPKVVRASQSVRKGGRESVRNGGSGGNHDYGGWIASGGAACAPRPTVDSFHPTRGLRGERLIITSFRSPLFHFPTTRCSASFILSLLHFIEQRIILE